jgi:hypothetical protein
MNFLRASIRLHNDVHDAQGYHTDASALHSTEHTTHVAATGQNRQLPTQHRTWRISATAVLDANSSQQRAGVA